MNTTCTLTTIYTGKITAFRPTKKEKHMDIYQCNCPLHQIKDQGYRDGLNDARNGRTPEHPESAYRFPREASTEEQKAYNLSYIHGQKDVIA